MIDCHVLTLDERADWRALCLNSIHDQPCDVRVLPGVRGGTNAARMAAFDSTAAEYVSWADPDDLVEPGAYQACAAALRADPSLKMVWMDERVMDASGRLVGVGACYGLDTAASLPTRNRRSVHHMVVLHRSVIDAARAHVELFSRGVEWLLACVAAAMGPVLKIAAPGYRWRMHAGGDSNLPEPRSISGEALSSYVIRNWT